MELLKVDGKEQFLMNAETEVFCFRTADLGNCRIFSNLIRTLFTVSEG